MISISISKILFNLLSDKWYIRAANGTSVPISFVFRNIIQPYFNTLINQVLFSSIMMEVLNKEVDRSTVRHAELFFFPLSFVLHLVNINRDFV